MEEDDGDGGEDLTPFWLQSNGNLRRTDQLRRRASSVFFSSGLVVLLLLVTAVLFLVFVVPSTLSLSSHIFRPNGVKKSWDSLNVLLVLVAVVFGFLSKNKDEDRYSPSNYVENQESVSNKQNETQKSNPSTPNHWYNFHTIEGEKSNLSSSGGWYDYPGFESKIEYKNPILRRNSNSYPDLREFSSTRWAHENFQRRFDDDMNVGTGRVMDPGQLHRRHRSLEEVDHPRVPSETKTVFVDTLVNKSMPAERFPHPSPPPPYRPIQPSSPPTELQEKSNRKQGTVVRKKERSRRKVEKDLESLKAISTEKTPPPPPPPPPPPLPQQSRDKSDRKRGGSGGSSSATKDFLNSLYHKKKKKQRQKSVDNLDLLLHQTEAPLSFQLPPSSPPSPPPPSVFQNLFSSKKHKRKRTITVTVKSPSPGPPPPPTPPEPPTPRNAEPELNPSSRKAPFASQNLESIEKLAEISNSGGESPLNRVPPPPPPPPPPFFKKPAWKFVVQGDYVRLDSVNSSRSGSPDLDELDSDAASDTPNAMAQPLPSPFCPSPDVNSKAESFITNFRAKLKLERNHSMKKSRELGLSSLGPGPGPSQI